MQRNCPEGFSLYDDLVVKKNSLWMLNAPSQHVTQTNKTGNHYFETVHKSSRLPFSA